MAAQSDRSFWIFNAMVSTAAVGFLGWLLLLREGGGIDADLGFMPGVNATLNAARNQNASSDVGVWRDITVLLSNGCV